MANKTTKTDIYKIDPRNIVVKDGFNSRTDFGDIQELADSIKASNGPIKAISVVPFKDENGEEKYRLVDGERRYRAVMLLIEQGFDIPRIKAEFVPKNTTDIDLLVNQLQSNEGKAFNEYELGQAYKKFEDMGLSHKEISEKLGVARWKVDCFLKHLTRDERVQSLLKDGKISGVQVRHIYQQFKDDEKAVKEILKMEKAREAKDAKKVTLKDADIYTNDKDTKVVAEGLKTLFLYIENYSQMGANISLDLEEVYKEITKGGKTIRSVFEHYLSKKAV